MNNFEEELVDTRDERDERWEALMLVKPHVVRGSTSHLVTKTNPETGEITSHGVMQYYVRYPRLVLEN